MTWSDEFDDSYAVPAEIAGHPDLEDDSWHNNTCPTFHLENRNLTVWVEHPDPEEREGWEHRYSITRGGYVESDAQVLYAGDDLAEVLRVVNGINVTVYQLPVTCFVTVTDGDVTKVTFLPAQGHGEARWQEGPDTPEQLAGVEDKFWAPLMGLPADVVWEG